MGRKFPPEDQTPTGRGSAGLPAEGKGLRGIQEFRRIRRARPELEDYEVWALVGYGPKERAIEAGAAPWADGRASPAEARWRGPTAERPEGRTRLGTSAPAPSPVGEHDGNR